MRSVARALVVVLVCFAALFVSAAEYDDCDANFIAFLGNLAVLILGIALSVWPGQPEENIYGPSPDQT